MGGFPIFFGAVALCVVGVFVLVIAGLITGNISSSGVSTQCINGYTFVRNMYDGGLVQMMDEVGKGVRCQ